MELDQQSVTDDRTQIFLAKHTLLCRSNFVVAQDIDGEPVYGLRDLKVGCVKTRAVENKTSADVELLSGDGKPKELGTVQEYLWSLFQFWTQKNPEQPYKKHMQRIHGVDVSKNSILMAADDRSNVKHTNFSMFLDVQVAHPGEKPQRLNILLIKSPVKFDEKKKQFPVKTFGLNSNTKDVLQRYNRIISRGNFKLKELKRSEFLKYKWYVFELSEVTFE